MPLGGLIGFGGWAATFYSTRYVSLASILAAVSLPVSSWFLYRSPIITGVAGLIAAFVVIRHRANIQRLLAGTESKFAKKKPEDGQR
jgi:glycerol-3-phosphate acyltransferase PlsY